MRKLSWQRDAIDLSGVDFCGRGAPVVLLHGLAGHAAEWRPLASNVTGAFRVLAGAVRLARERA